MTVEVRAFARAREIMGPRMVLELPEGATVGAAWEQLCQQFTPLGAFVLRGLAVNREYVGLDHLLQDGDELAVIPPVSGG